MTTEQRVAQHPGGGFNPPQPTTRGGPDYGRFVEAVRTLQDHARAVDAPDEVITEAADLIEAVSKLLDLPNRGNILQVPVHLGKSDDGRKIFMAGRLLDGEAVLAEAEALFVKLLPGQP